MSSKRLLELDAIRGLAAVAVVFYHFFARYDQIYGHKGIDTSWTSFGHYGVHLFFIVSGYVIFWTLNRVDKPLDFIVSRFSRLYPAYWGAVFLTFSIVSIWGLSGRETTIDTALLNLLMFHQYLGVSHVDGVYWTLTVELTFYFWIFSLYLASSLDRVEKIFITAIILSVVNSLDIINVPGIVAKALLFDTLPLFLAGICMYKLVNQSTGRKKTIFALSISLFSSAIIYSITTSLLFLAFYVFFYMAVSGRLKLLSNRVLVFLGSISYSLYLLHQNIGYVIINNAYEAQVPPLLGILIAFVVSILLSTVFVKLIEKPALSYLREKYKKSNRLQKLANKFVVNNGKNVEN